LSTLLAQNPWIHTGSASLRRALATSVAFAFVATFAASDADAARKPKKNRSEAAQVGKKREAPNFGTLPPGPLQIVVSTGGQHATLYANGVRIEQTKVSTGTPSKPTPLGVFSVIEKDRWHRSNLYGSAPMFYMHRLTWSGVAMHEGMLPGYAASHGCIRMPTHFVSRLWNISKLGVRVVVARNDPAPYEFSHAKLFNPLRKPVADQISDLGPLERLRSTIAANETTRGLNGRPIVLAQVTPLNDAASGPDITNQTPDEPKVTTDVAPPAGGTARVVGSTDSTEGLPPSPAPAEVEGIASTPVVTPPAAPQAVAAPAADTIEPPPASAAAASSSEPDKPEYNGTEPNKPAPPRNRAAEPNKRAGQVAVFISRAEKKLFVRQGFIPVFEMPIEIARPDQPLGTHVFTAMEITDGGAHMRWNAITMAPENPAYSVESGKRRGKKAEAPVRPTEVKAPSTAAEALERVNLPPEAVDRISELLVPGSSLIISDHGLGRETGRYTEFIVLTR